MIAIRQEIAQVEQGAWPGDDNPLHNAPHPASDVTSDEWSHPYSRATAAVSTSGDKYWVPVSRIDQAYGDRNLVCACPPVEAYE
jgi:glycine dehydrogenase